MSMSHSHPDRVAFDDFPLIALKWEMPTWLKQQRWFGAKDSEIQGVELIPLGHVAHGRCALNILNVTLSQGSQRYFLPLSRVDTGDAAMPVATNPVLVRISQGNTALIDGASDTALAEALLDEMRSGDQLRHDGRCLAFERTQALTDLETDKARLLSVEQSNATIAFDETAVLKIYRRLRSGIQPDVEVARHLTLGGFEHTPPFLGSLTLHEVDTDPTYLAAAFAYVRNEGDAWVYLSARVKALLARDDIEEDAGLRLCDLLGSRTAAMHRALARETEDQAFSPEPVTSEDLRAWSDEAREDLSEACISLENALDGMDDEADALARRVLDRRNDVFDRIDRVASLDASGSKHRIHGDYHLGQVLVTKDDVAIIDFEGEPRRNLAARRSKSCGLRDVAGMLRSLDYAAGVALRSTKATPGAVDDWRVGAMKAFLDAYRREISGSSAYPEARVAEALLDLFGLQKVAYEIAYELSNRPTWVKFPLGGLLALLDEEVPR